MLVGKNVSNNYVPCSVEERSHCNNEEKIIIIYISYHNTNNCPWGLYHGDRALYYRKHNDQRI